MKAVIRACKLIVGCSLKLLCMRPHSHWHHLHYMAYVMGDTLNSFVVFLSMALNSFGAIWGMISSVAALCATAVNFLCCSYQTFCAAASLRAGPVDYFVQRFSI